MTNTTNAPTRPANLDSTKLHSPAEVREWTQAMADYHKALRDIENIQQRKAQVEIAHQNRYLTDQEYFEEAVKRKQALDEIAAEREKVEKAKALEEIERLMSSPPTVDVSHRSEFLFMREVVQWANRGYGLADDGFHSFMPGMYYVTMQAPAQVKKVGSK